MTKISAIILTLNEERNIARCLDSLSDLVDEIVVVDSFSTDKTQEIVSKYDARFIKQEFLGYIEQKNFALGLAKYDHVLSLDADEALSETLRDSVKKVKQDFCCDGYYMNRLANYCGQWIRHSGWYPDRKMRLFDRRKGEWKGTNPHDKYMLQQDAEVGVLQGDLLHYTFYTVEEHLKQIDNFSSIAAQAKYNEGIRSNAWKLLVKPIARFVKGYLFKLGFLDGYYGWLIGIYSAKATYLKYLKLLRIQRTS